MSHWRFTHTESGDRAVTLGGRLATWGHVERHRPRLAASSLARIEANGLDHFTSYHPALGYLAGGLGGAQPGLCPPPIELCPPAVVRPPVTGGGPSVAPEPATAALVGVGLLVMVWACRRWGRQ